MGALLMFGLIIAMVIISVIYFSRQDREKERLSKIQQERREAAKRERAKSTNDIYTATDGNRVYIDNGKVTISEE